MWPLRHTVTPERGVLLPDQIEASSPSLRQLQSLRKQSAIALVVILLCFISFPNERQGSAYVTESIRVGAAPQMKGMHRPAIQNQGRPLQPSDTVTAHMDDPRPSSFAAAPTSSSGHGVPHADTSTARYVWTLLGVTAALSPFLWARLQHRSGRNLALQFQQMAHHGSSRQLWNTPNPDSEERKAAGDSQAGGSNQPSQPFLGMQGRQGIARTPATPPGDDYSISVGESGRSGGDSAGTKANQKNSPPISQGGAAPQSSADEPQTLQESSEVAAEIVFQSLTNVLTIIIVGVFLATSGLARGLSFLTGKVFRSKKEESETSSPAEDTPLSSSQGAPPSILQSTISSPAKTAAPAPTKTVAPVSTETDIPVPPKAAIPEPPKAAIPVPPKAAIPEPPKAATPVITKADVVTQKPIAPPPQAQNVRAAVPPPPPVASAPIKVPPMPPVSQVPPTPPVSQVPPTPPVSQVPKPPAPPAPSKIAPSNLPPPPKSPLAPYQQPSIPTYPLPSPALPQMPDFKVPLSPSQLYERMKAEQAATLPPPPPTPTPKPAPRQSIFQVVKSKLSFKKMLLSNFSAIPKPTSKATKVPKAAAIKPAVVITPPKGSLPPSTAVPLGGVKAPSKPKTSPVLSAAEDITKLVECILGTWLLVKLEKEVARVMVTYGIAAFPSSVLTMWVLFVALSVVNFLIPSLVSFITYFFTPVTSFYSSWLGFTVVPALMNMASLPNAFPWIQYRTAILLLAARQVPMMGIYAVMMRWCGLHIRPLSTTVAGREDISDDKLNEPPGAALCAIMAMAVWCAVGGMLYLPQYALSFRFLLYFSALGLSYGTALHAQRRLQGSAAGHLFHPLVITTAAGLGIVRLTGHLQGIPFQESLQIFQSQPLGPLPSPLPDVLGPLVKDGSLLSPGDIISCLLGPGIVTLAFRLHSYRNVLKQLAIPLSVLSLGFAAGSMALSALLLHWVPLPAVLATPLLIPPSTSPWALQAGTVLAMARPSLLSAAAVFSAILGGLAAPLIWTLQDWKSHVVRGASQGAVGAEKADCKREMAVSLLSAVFTGTSAALLCCIPAFRVFLYQLAGI